MKNQDRLVIDGWLVDVESHRIACDGVEQKLEPRSMELLVYLASRAGQVVSRADIEQQVWRGRVVGYEALSGSIAKIRKAFGDTNRQHRIIETIPKKGYRLLVTVIEQAEGDEQLTSSNKRMHRKYLSYALLLIIVMALALTIYFTGLPGEGNQPTKDPYTIAVLPFNNLGGDSAQEYFRRHPLLTRSLRDFSVISWGLSARQKGMSASAPEWATAST